MTFIAYQILVATIVLILAYRKVLDFQRGLIFLGVQFVVAGGAALIAREMCLSDTQTINGAVTSKVKEQVSCSHDYRCHCHQVEHCSEGTSSCDSKGRCTKGPRSCHYEEECDTCYEHSHDYSWVVKSSTTYEYVINRIDRQGVKEPGRWTEVKIGDPTADISGYKNYLLIDPGSLFRKQAKDHYPDLKYPGEIYDYYKINRIIGDSAGPYVGYNDQLSRINIQVGTQRQGNVILVLTKHPHDYFYHVQKQWVGGKKNDVVVFVGLGPERSITWSDVLAWSKTKDVQDRLREDLVEMKTFEPEAALKVIQKNVLTYYQRKPMADFEYLRYSVPETTAQTLAPLLTTLLLAIGFFFLEKSLQREKAMLSSSRIRYRSLGVLHRR